MISLARISERWRNIPAAVSFIVVLLLLAGMAVIIQNERSYRDQKLNEIKVQSEILAASVTAALDFGDPSTAQESVDALRVNQQVNAAGIYDARGTLFAGYERVRGTLPNKVPLGPKIGTNLIETMTPVRQGDHQIGTVYLSNIREPLARRLTRYSVIGLLVVMAALVVMVLGIATTALRRANLQLEERAAALSEAYHQLRLETEERVNAEEQLRQAHKMQALGQLTGGIAHDFNNLLTVIQGSADLLLRPDLPEDKRLRFAEAIVETAGRATALTSQLLAFARRQPLQPEVFDLSERIRAMTDLLDRTLGERIEIRTNLSRDLPPIEADPSQLESALLNIAVNARDAMPEGGVLTIRTEEAPPMEDGRQAIALSVSDTGGGIDEDTLARAFEPFFTTKSVGKGTGLGLSQVYGFATQSGGDVRLTSTPGQGTTVTLVLPCTDQPMDITAPLAGRSDAHRTGCILVVDDNEDVGAFAETLLTEIGHTVVRANSAAEAIALAEANSFDALFTDVVMPGMSGLELAEAMKQRFPALPIILTTGYSDQVLTSGTGGLPVVFKPYRLDTLASALDKALTPEPA